jgi:hypothetical protein
MSFNSDQKLLISKHHLFYFLVISSLYLAGFDLLIRGIVRSFFPGGEIAAIILIQSYIYLIPLIFCWQGSIDKRFKLALLLLLFLVVSFPIYKYGNIISFIFSIKVYLLCFFYLPILKYLSKNEKFNANFFKHFVILASIFATWSLIEVISLYYFPNINIFMISFSASEDLRNGLGGRPLGMQFDFVSGAVMVSFLCVICFLKKNYLWAFLLLLLLSSCIRVKTWTIATIIVLSILLLKKKNIKAITILILISCCGLLFFQEEAIYYFNYVFKGDGSGPIMLNLLVEDGWFFLKETGILPNGFIREIYSMLDTGLTNIPFEVSRVETNILTVLFQMGLIATCIWMIIIYYSFFKHDYFSLSNDYKVLLFLSLFTFVHVTVIIKPFIFIFLLFCGIQAENKTKLPGYRKSSSP